MKLVPTLPSRTATNDTTATQDSHNQALSNKESQLMCAREGKSKSSDVGPHDGMTAVEMKRFTEDRLTRLFHNCKR